MLLVLTVTEEDARSVDEPDLTLNDVSLTREREGSKYGGVEFPFMDNLGSPSFLGDVFAHLFP
jgi:hypothetical protein